MAASDLNRPLVVVAGPTASGKTALAIELAKKYQGEIICADSRTIYKYMDIGTAKPTPEEQLLVPHWGLDLVEPGEPFSAAEFKKYATQKIAEIRSRGHIPFLVGGTGLYVDAIIFDYQFGPAADADVRAQLEELSLEELHQYCININVLLPENNKNKRYVIRAIEQKNTTTIKRDDLIENCYVVGITTDKEILRQRIAARSEHLFDNGVVNEATLLGKKYGWNSEAMTANIYRLVRRYLEDEITLDDARREFATLDWRLAKRQLTWLRRNQCIQWFTLDDARNYIIQVLAK